MYYATSLTTPIGNVTLASDGENLVGLWNEGQKYFGKSLPAPPVEQDNLPVFDRAKTWLHEYFAGETPSISQLPLRPIGSDFRQTVWKILCEIPYGEVCTYGDIAKKMAAFMKLDHMSAQAVGGAVGHNPISIIIPCHRVVGTGGSLTGYAGGISKKVQLLKLEGADMQGLFVPEEIHTKREKDCV